MASQIENLLKGVSRPVQLLLGWLCALISGAFAVVLVWLAYLVYWRNPREYGVDDRLELTTFFVFGLFLIIAWGFSVLAFRLIRRRRKGAVLVSPLLLRFWGAFFALGSVAVLIASIVTQDWTMVQRGWTMLVSSASMAVAAFLLARIRERNNSNSNANTQTSASPIER